MLQKKDKSKILFFRESTFKIAELIFNYPNKQFHIRLLEKETGFSTSAVTHCVEELSRFGIIKIEETPLTKNIRANLDSETYRFYKMTLNLYRLKRYGLVDNLVKGFYNPEAIVVFGSFAKGEDVENSDIDILVISNRKEKVGLTVYEKVFNRKIDIYVLNDLNKSSKEFKNAVANGVVLHGYLKVV